MPKKSISYPKVCKRYDGLYYIDFKLNNKRIRMFSGKKIGSSTNPNTFQLKYRRNETINLAKEVYDTDVISKLPYDGKQITNDILSHILNIFKLDNKLVSKIKDYQSKEGLQNEKGLDIYIDQILTEKANKK